MRKNLFLIQDTSIGTKQLFKILLSWIFRDMQLASMNYIQTKEESHEYWPTGKSHAEACHKTICPGTWVHLSGRFHRAKNANIETELLTKFLTRKGYSPVLINRALKELQDAAGDQSVNLYDLNEQTYKKLRYGVKVSESVGQHKITVQFVDWEHPLENDFTLPKK